MSVKITHNWKTDQWDWPMQHNDGIVKIQEDNENWEVGLEAQFFTPNEIEVKVAGNHLVIHCKHESRSDDHGTIAREISRCYKLPPNVDTSSIKSHLTNRGILHISAKKTN